MYRIVLLQLCLFHNATTMERNFSPDVFFTSGMLSWGIFHACTDQMTYTLSKAIIHCVCMIMSLQKLDQPLLGNRFYFSMEVQVKQYCRTVHVLKKVINTPCGRQNLHVSHCMNLVLSSHEVCIYTCMHACSVYKSVQLY